MKKIISRVENIFNRINSFIPMLWYKSPFYRYLQSLIEHIRSIVKLFPSRRLDKLYRGFLQFANKLHNGKDNNPHFAHIPQSISSAICIIGGLPAIFFRDFLILIIVLLTSFIFIIHTNRIKLAANYYGLLMFYITLSTVVGIALQGREEARILMYLFTSMCFSTLIMYAIRESSDLRIILKGIYTAVVIRSICVLFPIFDENPWQFTEFIVMLFPLGVCSVFIKKGKGKIMKLLLCSIPAILGLLTERIQLREIWAMQSDIFTKNYVEVGMMIKDIYERGAGVGTVPFLRMYSENVLHHAGDGYFTLLLKLGMFVLIIILWLFIMTLRKSIIRLFNADAVMRLITISGLISLSGVFAMSAISFNWSRPRTLVLYFILIGIIGGRGDIQNLKQEKRAK